MAEALIRKLLVLVEEQYNVTVSALGPIVEYAPDEGGIYRVDLHGSPPVVVRLFARNRPLERVLGDAAILAHIESHTVPAERLVLTCTGEGATDLDGQGVLVTRFVPGRRPDRSPATLRQLGETLGRLHALPPVPSNDARLGRRAGSLPNEDLRYGRAQLARVSEQVPSEQRLNYEELRDLLDAINDGETLPFALTHSDCHLDNFVLGCNGPAVLIDWAGAGQGPRIAALGLLLYSCAVASPGDHPGERQPDLSQLRNAVDAVIEGYCRFSFPTTEELAYLPDAIRVRPAVISTREFAAAVESRKLSPPIGWWQHLGRTESVAALSYEAVESRRS